jgi:hypothetical protein
MLVLGMGTQNACMFALLCPEAVTTETRVKPTAEHSSHHLMEISFPFMHCHRAPTRLRRAPPGVDQLARHLQQTGWEEHPGLQLLRTGHPLLLHHTCTAMCVMSPCLSICHITITMVK